MVHLPLCLFIRYTGEPRKKYVPKKFYTKITWKHSIGEASWGKVINRFKEPVLKMMFGIKTRDNLFRLKIEKGYLLYHKRKVLRAWWLMQNISDWSEVNIGCEMMPATLAQKLKFSGLHWAWNGYHPWKYVRRYGGRIRHYITSNVLRGKYKTDVTNQIHLQKRYTSKSMEPSLQRKFEVFVVK